jgi:predicted ATP-grasp superfamily ATP-dependent carboligase
MSAGWYAANGPAASGLGYVERVSGCHVRRFKPVSVVAAGGAAAAAASYANEKTVLVGLANVLLCADTVEDVAFESVLKWWEAA